MERSVVEKRRDVFRRCHATRGRVFVETDEELSKKLASGIIVPIKYQKPISCGKILSASKLCHGMEVDLENGDDVFYFMDNVVDMEEDMGLFQSCAYNTGVGDDEEERVTDINLFSTMASIIQGKGKLPDINYGEAIPFGAKIYVRMIRDDEVVKEDGLIKTKSGIILPDKHFSQGIATGRIINMGPKANDPFVGDVLEVGQLVMIKRKPSGSPIQEQDNSVVWLTNSFEVIARWDDKQDLWLPVGGWAFMREVSLTHKMGKTSVPKGNIQETLALPAGQKLPDSMMTQIDAYIPRNGGVPIPVSAANKRNFVETFGIIEHIGGGVTEIHPYSDKTMGVHGPFPVGRGDAIIHGPILNIHGQYEKSGASMDGFINGKHVYVINPLVMHGFVKRSENETIDELAREFGIE